MAVFYQKYRPVNFSQVVGHEAILKAMRNASKNQALAHAYLLTGGRGLGKTTLARILAKAVNCNQLSDGDPCGTCETCMSIAGGNFLDVVEIDAASHTGVDNIRELIENINFKPTFGRTKVFIIDEVHMLSKAAFNALLKTLEEPPSHVLFVLATTDAHKVPETVVSRTQRFDFKQIKSQDIAEVLKRIVKQDKLKLPDGTLDLIVQNSQGGLRDALTQLGAVAVLPSDATLDDVSEILGTTSRQTIEQLFELITTGQDQSLPEFFEQQTAKNFDPLGFAKSVLSILQEWLELSMKGQNQEIPF
ncbi:MAG: DNA polymerase III subunit gamma/tau, partial [Candidatus Doudnabacteria bacterium]